MDGTGDGVTQTSTPLRVAMLLDGNEGYGLAYAAAGMLSNQNARRVSMQGVFLGPGDGLSMLGPRFAESYCLNTGPLSPLRRPGGPRFDPVYLLGRLVVLMRSLRALRRWMREHRPDIVHTHTNRLATLAWWATRSLPIRRVWHCHGAFPAAGRLSRRFIQMAERGGVHHVAAISRFVKETLPEPLRSNSTVIYNGVDVEPLRRAAAPGEFRQRFDVRPEQPLIGIFGAVVPIKGHQFFLEAAAEVARKLPDARFAIVGGTTDAFEHMGALVELNAHIRRLGLEQRIIQTGFLADGARFMPDFDLIVLPSVFTPTQAGEGFGMVLIEAMSHEVAVIATRCGAPPEIITHEQDGLLVPPKDGPALAEAMLRLLNDPDLRRRLAAAGLATVRQRFDSAQTAAALDALYAGLLKPFAGDRGAAAPAPTGRPSA